MKVGDRTMFARLGLGEPCRTLHEVASELGVGVERARQIEAEALAKCRAVLVRRGLSLADFAAAVERAHHACSVEPADALDGERRGPMLGVGARRRG